MKLDLTIQNLDKVQAALAKLSGPQAREAYAKAINDTGFMVRKAMQAELRKFDRVTPFIANAPKLIAATPDNLSAAILPTLDSRNKPGKGGKIGVDPQQVLQAQEFGGRRADKRSEVLLRKAGFLQPGWQTAIPKEPFPGSDDGRGNLNGSFLRSVLSYLQTYQAGQGHDQNMKKAAMERMRKFGKATISKRAQQQPGPYMGRSYFVAGGRAAVTWDNKKYRTGAKQTAHLQPGIWAAIGVGKSRQLRPVLIFVRAPSYQPRISMERIAKESGAQDHLDKRIRFRVRQLAESV